MCPVDMGKSLFEDTKGLTHTSKRGLSANASTKTQKTTREDGATWGHPPSGFRGFVEKSPFFSRLNEAQRHAQYRGRFECAHKKEAGGQLLRPGARVSGLRFFQTEKPFGVVGFNGKTVKTTNTIQDAGSPALKNQSRGQRPRK